MLQPRVAPCVLLLALVASACAKAEAQRPAAARPPTRLEHALARPEEARPKARLVQPQDGTKPKAELVEAEVAGAGSTANPAADALVAPGVPVPAAAAPAAALAAANPSANQPEHDGSRARRRDEPGAQNRIPVGHGPRKPKGEDGLPPAAPALPGASAGSVPGDQAGASAGHPRRKPAREEAPVRRGR